MAATEGQGKSGQGVGMTGGCFWQTRRWIESGRRQREQDEAAKEGEKPRRQREQDEEVKEEEQRRRREQDEERRRRERKKRR